MKTLLPFFLSTLLFACGGSGQNAGSAKSAVKATAWTNFSGDRAMEDVKALVAMGPRPSGSAEIETSRQYIEKKLKEAGWETQRQDFAAETLLRGKIKMSNIRARWPLAGQQTWSRYVTTLACSHYDTKWFQATTFVGANDGGSSTGLLLEVARATAAVPDFAATLELVFFDGEEAITGFTEPGGFADARFDGLFGSRHYAKELRKLPKGQLPKHGVIFDMIGDQKLEVEFAANCSPRLIELAMESADELGFSRHFRETSTHITDDHVPLSWLGMEVIDFIDLESYRDFWHTSADTLDKLNPQSIEIAGRTGLLFLEKHLAE
jgi:glutaminyl-peptide cyclotransferase